MMHLFFYEIIIRCLIPFALAKIFYRALISSDHLNHFNERLGFYSKQKKSFWKNKQIIWLHCVSVGETKAINNLIEVILSQACSAPSL